MSIYSKTYRVSWVETDAAGVVHYTNYFRYCERLEEDFLNDINLDFEAIALKYGVWFPRVSAVGHFKWPLRFNQRFRVDLIDISLRDRSIRYKFEIWNLDDEKISAECEIVIACVSITQRKSISIPAEIRELFANLR